MRMQFKNILLGVSIWTMVLVAGCKREISTATRVHPDGSFDRTVTVRGDSSVVLDGSFPLPRDSSWMVTKKMEIVTNYLKKDEKKSERELVYTARKMFRNARDLNAELDQKRDTARVVQISFALDKKFQWFNTFYVYREVYKASTPFLRVPVSDYLNPKELELYCQMIDTLKEDTLGLDKKLEAWLDRCVFEEYYQALILGAETLQDPNLTPQMIVSRKDSLFRTVMRSDQFKDDLDKTQFLETFFKTKSVRKLSGIVHLTMKDIEKKHEFLMQMGDDFYQNQVTMPGIILDTNAQAIDGNKAVWKFNGRQFIWADYEMRVESRVVNRWVGYLTAGLLLLVLAGIAVAIFRR